MSEQSNTQIRDISTIPKTIAAAREIRERGVDWHHSAALMMAHAETLERELNEAQQRIFNLEASLRIQRANYLLLHDAVMGDGCATSDVKDVDAIARSHRETFDRWKQCADELAALVRFRLDPHCPCATCTQKRDVIATYDNLKGGWE